MPVTGLGRHAHYQAATARIVCRQGRGFCLRLESEDFDHPGLATQVEALLAYMGLGAWQVDLLIDFREHIAHSATAQAGHARTLLAQTPRLARWRRLAIMGSSLPAVPVSETPRPGTVLQR